MRGGHRGSTDGIGGVVGSDPVRGDGTPGSKDVDTDSIIRVGSPLISNGGGPDSNGSCHTSRGIVARGIVTISSSNSVGYT